MNSSTLNSATAGSSTGQGRLRLTRRGRVVLIGLPLLLLAALVLTLLGFFNAPAKAASVHDGLEVTKAVKVTVGAGQTLWTIAGTSAPERDPRDVVAEIVELNGLDSSVVKAGQVLFVPSHA